MTEIRGHINNRSTTQMNKIAELAALELVPTGSIDGKELRRLRSYAIDLVRSCREIKRDPAWVWTASQGGTRKKKNKGVVRELTDKEKFQLALNPHSTIGEIHRQNTIHEQKHAVSDSRRSALEMDSDSDGSFMSESNFQADDKSVISDSDIKRVKSVFSVSRSNFGELEESNENSEPLDNITAGLPASFGMATGDGTKMTAEVGEVGAAPEPVRSIDGLGDVEPAEGKKKTVVPMLKLGRVSSDYASPRFSVRSEGSFDMADAYKKGVSFQAGSNPAMSEIKVSPLACAPISVSSSDSGSEGASDVDAFEDFLVEHPTVDGAPWTDSVISCQSSAVSASSVDAEDSHVFRVTDNKPTPISAKSPIVPKLGLDALCVPASRPPRSAELGAATFSEVAKNFGSDSVYSDSNDDEDDDAFSTAANKSLVGMVSLGSGRINSRASFCSTGRSSFGSSTSDIGMDNLLVVASGGLSSRGMSPRHPLPSPRLGCAAPSPRDEDFPVNKSHRRTSRHSLVPEGHEHVTVAPPIRSSGMVPTPIIHSSMEGSR